MSDIHAIGPVATAEETEQLRAVRRRFGIAGNSPALLGALDRAVKVAPFDLAVLIEGESGSGKEFFPRIIHQEGARKHRRYIAVNCGAIPEGTIDSELFGHEKGSFTGAVATRKGYFEEADGGTIFLDEVAELPLTTQARLLRVLETGEFIKVGSSKVQRTDIRVVAATNVDLLKAVEERRFREDLYYRLSTVRIQVPPLHERRDDIEPLARRFAADFAERYMTAPVRLGEDARRLMRAYRWPGNVRQLKNVVEQLALFHAGAEVTDAQVRALLPSEDRRHGLHLADSEERTMAPLPSYAAERELLWQTVMTLRAEMLEMRRRLDALAPLAATPEAPAPAAPRSQLIRWPETPVLTIGSAPAAAGAAPGATPLEQSERDTIARALAANMGSRKLTARQLKISERTLYRKMKEYGIGRTESDAEPAPSPSE